MAGRTISGLTLAVPGAARGALTATDLTSRLLNQFQSIAQTQKLLGGADLDTLIKQRTLTKDVIRPEIAKQLGFADLSKGLSVRQEVDRAEGFLLQEEALKQEGLTPTQVEEMIKSGEFQLDLRPQAIKDVAKRRGLPLTLVQARERLGPQDLTIAERSLLGAQIRGEAEVARFGRRVGEAERVRTAKEITKLGTDAIKSRDTFLKDIATAGPKSFRSSRAAINEARANDILRKLIDSGKLKDARTFKEDVFKSSKERFQLIDVPAAAPVPPSPGRAIPPPRQTPGQQLRVPQPPPTALTPEETQQVEKLGEVTTAITGNIKSKNVTTISRSDLEDAIIRGAVGRVGVPSRRTIDRVINEIIRNTGIRVSGQRGVQREPQGARPEQISETEQLQNFINIRRDLTQFPPGDLSLSNIINKNLGLDPKTFEKIGPAKISEQQAQRLLREFGAK